MKIQSQFKDYYDHVAHIYGGGDPKVLYLRNRLGEVEKFHSDIFVKGLHFTQSEIPDTRFETLIREFQHKAKWLAIAGKLYLILTPYTPFATLRAPAPENWTVLNETRHSQVWEYLHAHPRRRYSWAHNEVTINYLGYEIPAVLELSRKVNSPVFTFTVDRGNVQVDGNIPILSTLGIPALISAEQIYQDIAYFLGNTMHGSPDTMPAVKMTDKEKISAAGFDLKQSFRHRI